MRTLSIIVYSAFVCFVAGCIAHDPRVNEYKATTVLLDSFNGTFVNKTIYKSNTGEFLGHEDFGDVVGVYNSTADFIVLNFDMTNGLNVKLVKDDKTIFEKTYKPGSELEVKNNGQLLFPVEHHSSFGQQDAGPGVGYGNDRFRLLIDDENNLVAINSGGAGGLIGVFPFIQSTKLMSVYPRVE